MGIQRREKCEPSFVSKAWVNLLRKGKVRNSIHGGKEVSTMMSEKRDTHLLKEYVGYRLEFCPCDLLCANLLSRKIILFVLNILGRDVPKALGNVSVKTSERKLNSK